VNIVKHIQILFLVLAPMFLLGMDNCCEPQTILGERPASVQAKCDRAFENNKSAGTRGDWTFNGASNYYLMGLYEDRLLKYLASKNYEKDDIYIIDVGCARGTWGQNAKKILLENESEQQTGKHFYIFSITGGVECEESVTTEDNVTLYQFTQFKIENICEAFLQRGIDLKNKVDLIVSRMTLCHLVDPLGTLKQMYSLLTPFKGMLMAAGFTFMLDNLEKQYFPTPGTMNIFTTSSTIPLFGPSERLIVVERQFLLKRNSNQELGILLEYTGDLHKEADTRYCAGGTLTVFKGQFVMGSVNHLIPAKCEPENQPTNEEADSYISEYAHFINYYPRYCDENNELSKALFVYLDSFGLFYPRRF
jgi:hypothetical protein